MWTHKFKLILYRDLHVEKEGCKKDLFKNVSVVFNIRNNILFKHINDV